MGIGIRGPYNIQFIVDENDRVYVIEVNPRSSRTVPFLSKSTGVNLANMATKVALGQSLKQQGFGTAVAPEKETLVRQGAGVLLLPRSAAWTPTFRRK